MECGNHYARSLASFGLLIALSGYEYDLVNNKISFSPKIEDKDFKCFFICEKGWGLYNRKKNEISTVYGKLDDITLK